MLAAVWFLLNKEIKEKWIFSLPKIYTRLSQPAPSPSALQLRALPLSSSWGFGLPEFRPCGPSAARGVLYGGTVGVQKAVPCSFSSGAGVKVPSSSLHMVFISLLLSHGSLLAQNTSQDTSAALLQRAVARSSGVLQKDYFLIISTSA